jgi:hypothetical protein
MAVKSPGTAAASPVLTSIFVRWTSKVSEIPLKGGKTIEAPSVVVTVPPVAGTIVWDGSWGRSTMLTGVRSLRQLTIR